MTTDYKKLFGQKSIILANEDRDKIGSEVESVGYMTEHLNQKDRFIPPVDFSEPKQFARFGSAEKYYIDAIDRIYKTYPYDGSLRERIQWELSSSYLGLHVFENGYPRRNGYVLFSANGWSTQSDFGDGYGEPVAKEYIFVKGGPNTSNRAKEKSIRDTSGDYRSGYANVWDPSKNRESNLKIGGLNGNTVEFWLKKDKFLGAAETNKEVICDVYTTAFDSSSINYGRLTVELSSSDSSTPFKVTYMSGASGFASSSIGTNLTNASIADNKWHHYAFTFKNTGSTVEVNLFVDGVCNQTFTTGSSIGYVSGNLNATVGSLATYPSGTFTILGPNPTLGWGKLSASLDEFRFWKTQRTSQEVGRFYIDAVGGGTNTDEANTNLGVYYKFNEGITQTASIDKNILDYSGRISNGTFIGYNSSARSIGSAMVESGKAAQEFKDPILYSFHPAVVEYRNKKTEEGLFYDYSNNSSIYHSLPAWIIEEDEAKEYSPLRNLTQIVGSYFDSLASQIEAIPKLKQKNYLSSSFKSYPFSDKLLESVGFTYFPELFSDATALEQFRNRGDKKLFAQKLYDVKNRIYQNIYNNIVYIYKTKGTEKSFRNLIRCFGLDDEIYKINLYGNRVTYQLKDNFSSVAEFKKYVNFALTGTQAATVFPSASSANPNSTSFIAGSETDNLENYLAYTMETEVAFPRRHSLAEVNTIVAAPGHDPSRLFRAYSPFKTASLFGMHQVDGVTEGDLTWASTDYANFQVYAIRDDDYSQRCYFKLTGVGSTVIPTLTSSYFDEVFDDTRWTFSVGVRPLIYPIADLPSGTAATVESTGYKVEFYGVEKVLDTTKNEFFLTSTIGATDAQRFMKNPKSIYIGAHRENFSGSLQEKSDGNISSTRVWLTHLSTGTLQQHAQDVKNYGVPNPYKSAYLYQTSMTGTRVPEIHTLVLNWVFDTLTGSDSNGQFLDQDFSSGSTSLQTRYNWIGNIVGKQYLPKGENFPPNFSHTVNKKYVYSAKKQLPEFVNSSEMINILSDDDIFFNKSDLLRPTNYYMYIEKSMYQTISEEMIRMFSSIKDFNNLIGEPVNKYRSKYKHMEKLRQLFFERVGNTPDLDKYIEFYKWVDQTLDVLLGYLVPASADISDQYGNNIRTLVESHVLERNKYKWQFPTLEDKIPDIEGNILGINELLYDWEFGHAPIQQFANNKSIAFNGVTGESQITVPDSDSLSFGATGFPAGEPSFSWAAWVKPTGDLSLFGDPFFVASKCSSPGTGDEYLFGHIPGVGLTFLIADGSGVTDDYIAQANATIVVDKWQHVCATYDGSRAPGGIKLYIDGAVQTTVGLSPGSYTAMSNTSADVVLGRMYAGTTAFVAEGFVDEVAAFDKELSSAEVLELYHSAQALNLKTFSAAANIVSWWRMGDKAIGTSPDYTIPDQISSNDATMSSFQGNSTSGVVSDAVRASFSTAEKCLWWKERAERSNAVITSRDDNIDSDKQAMLDSINNETNAAAPTLASSGSAGISSYQGSTFVIRKLAKPYKFKVDESRTTKGGTNYYPNKKVDIVRTETNLETSTNFLAVPAANIESFKDCNDELDLFTKRKYSFNALLRSELSTPTEKNYFNAKGALFTPFSLYSASISGGYYDAISNDFAPSVDITNLHEDTYGTQYGVPMQGPFTDKYVGGLQSRHVALTVDPTQTSSSNRPEGWSLSFDNNILTMSAPRLAGSVGQHPKATRLRDPVAKRPVNIRNIQQTTGSTIIGNYTKTYEVLMTNGRSINNRYFVKNEGVSASSINSQIVSGVLDYDLPGAAQSERDRQEVVINGLTSSARNDYIIVNRFSAPGDPSTMGFAYLDIEAQEYSVYNALPWRNLIVRDALQELYTDHTKQFGYFSDAQNSASYVLAGETYPGTSGSVNAGSYYTTAGYPDATASFHKINRNPRKVLKSTGINYTSSYMTGVVYDNWHVQHQIPQSDYQYAWITSSVLRTGSGIVNNPLLGFEQPDFSNASLASTDITFCSASTVGSWGGTNRYYGEELAGAIAGMAPDSPNFIPVDFAGLNMNIQEALTASTNMLGYPGGMVNLNPLDATDRATYPYKGGLVTRATSVGSLPGGGFPRVLNGLILHRQGPYGWPSWKQTRGANHPIIRTHRKENRQTFLKYNTLNLGGEVVAMVPQIKSQIEPPITSKFKPFIHHLKIKVGKNLLIPLKNKDLTIHSTYGNEKCYFTQPVLGSINLEKSDLVHIKVKGSNVGISLDQAQKTLIYDSLNKFILGPDWPDDPEGPNPVKEFMSLIVEETIFPRDHYTYLSGTRQRNNFSNKFWRDTRNARDTEGSADGGPWPNSQGFVVSQSIWPLDCRSNTNQEPKPNASTFAPAAGIEGELQNGYSLFFTSTPAAPEPGVGYPIPGATYNRRVPETSSYGLMFAGDTLWEANTQANINPFFNSYDEYVEDLKRIGKDYGIIPEFRISEHMEFYVNNSEDFLKQPPGWLTLTGSKLSSSDDPGFYTVYAHSDFMKYFGVVRDDYSQVAIPSELTLKCKALQKFLPYDGFYPAQRTVQLAQIFSQSLGSVASYSGTGTTNSAAGWRTLMAPIFAPGILYNSIKSGLAVSYPITNTTLGVPENSGSGIHITGSYLNNTQDSGDPRLKGEFNSRIPFEALASPDLYLEGVKVIDTEPHPSSFFNNTGTFHVGNPLFKYAMNNFLAEVPTFFLNLQGGGRLPALRTNWVGKDFAMTVTANKPYKMRIVCTNAFKSTIEGLDDNSDRKAQGASFIYNPPNVTMYNRSFDTSSLKGYELRHVGESGSTLAYGSSFGPPCDAVSSVNAYEASFEPYTPPYYNGYSHIELTYIGDVSGEATLSDILGSVTAEYYREPTRLAFSGSTAGSASMQLSESINWRVLESTWDPIANQASDRWYIQPKWVSPVLDFEDANITLPDGGGSGSVAKGMWHQYGSIPVAPIGQQFKGHIRLRAADVPQAYPGTQTPHLSLRKLCKFSKTAMHIGEMKGDGKIISEAIVAIPFIENSNTPNEPDYFNIDPLTITWAKEWGELSVDEFVAAGGNCAYKPSLGTVEMVQKMKKYVIPPQFDFLTNSESVSPIAMAIFEFSTRLTRQDLVNIWQNLPPKSAQLVVTGSEAKISIDLLRGSLGGLCTPQKGFSLLNEWPTENKWPSGIDYGFGAEEGTETVTSWQYNNMGPFPDNIQWLVFKVKQKAKTDYYDLLYGERPIDRRASPIGTIPIDETGARKVEIEGAPGERIDKDIPSYSYNWPYDFCSLVELVKISSAYTLTPDPSDPTFAQGD